MNRIIDANLNRATEGLRTIEEIARFILDNKEFSEELKNLRHQVSKFADENYEKLLVSRDTQNDVGTDISNPSKKIELLNVFKANFKRVQQALRVLADFGAVEGIDINQLENARYATYTLEKKMMEELNKKFNKIRLKDKNLYLVTDSSKFKNDNDFLNAVAASLEGGVDILQLREKNSSAKRIIELAKKIKELCAIYNAIFIINDRADIAKIVDADGVHIGQDDIDIYSARGILGPNKIIGLSTHAPQQALKAIEVQADYIGVGPVFETPTKPGRKSVGLEYVEWVSKNVDIPFYAIGGIDLENKKEVLKAGATQIAVVRAIINSKNPTQSAKEFKQTLNQLSAQAF